MNTEDCGDSQAPSSWQDLWVPTQGRSTHLIGEGDLSSQQPHDLVSIPQCRKWDSES